MTLGAASQQEIERIEQLDETDNDSAATRRGQILWIRGLNRLQHQIRVVNVFQDQANMAGRAPRQSITVHSLPSTTDSTVRTPV
jgi:Ca2+ transporting ATPase